MTAAFVLLLLLSFASRALSHSFMVKPDAYNRVFKTKSCEGSECQQACPNILSDSDMNNMPEKPAAVWQRGQRVNVKWAKNNHRGGLVRVSLVPVDKMMSRDWHKRLALWHGCWESGMFKCTGELCGTDTNNEGFQRDITIPNVFPDGNYVVAVLWYGGLHFSRDKGEFPDYYSCSFVKIQGGNAVGGSYQPFWEAGDTGEYEGASYTGNPANAGKCQTAADEPGECPNKTGCTGPSFWAVSKPYQNGNMPEKITPAIVAAAFDDLPEAPTSGSGEAANPTKTPEPKISPIPSNPSPISKPSSKPSSSPKASPALEMAPSSPRAVPVSPSPSAAIQPASPSPFPSLAATADEDSPASPALPSESPMSPMVTSSATDPTTESSDISFGMVCTGKYCCPASCGACGGTGCTERPGGAENCCIRSLKKSGNDCGEYPPPCTMYDTDV